MTYPITPVILAGGSGTRLWPVSRQSYPKQFCTLIGNESLFQQTALRLRPTNRLHFDLRHEAISRKFESGLSIPQVMAISGHQTASQLFRYVNLSDFDSVKM